MGQIITWWIRQVHLCMCGYSFQLPLTHPLFYTHTHTHMHTHIFKVTDVVVSAETSFIINLDSGVEWADVPYSKVSPSVTVAHIVQAGQSISPVWPLESWVLWKIWAEPEFRRSATVSSLLSECSTLRATCRFSFSHCTLVLPLWTIVEIYLWFQVKKKTRLHFLCSNTPVEKMNIYWQYQRLTVLQ